MQIPGNRSGLAGAFWEEWRYQPLEQSNHHIKAFKRLTEKALERPDRYPQTMKIR